jgi:hypothetical protein
MSYKDLEKKKYKRRKYYIKNKKIICQKSINYYLLHKENRKLYQKTLKCKQYRKQYRKTLKYKQYAKKLMLKKRYNLSQCDYDKLLELQNNFCKICGCLNIKLVIDHCHKTGKVQDYYVLSVILD